MSDDAVSHTLLNNTVWNSLVKHLLWNRRGEGDGRGERLVTDELDGNLISIIFRDLEESRGLYTPVTHRD